MDAEKYHRRTPHHVARSRRRALFLHLGRLLFVLAAVVLARELMAARAGMAQAALRWRDAATATGEARAAVARLRADKMDADEELGALKEDKAQAERVKRRVEAEAAQQERKCREETRGAEERRKAKLDDARWAARASSFKELNEYVRSTEAKVVEVNAAARDDLARHAALAEARDGLVKDAVAAEKARIFQRVFGTDDEKYVAAFYERLLPGNYRDGLALSREALSKSQALSHTRSGFSAVSSDGTRRSLTDTIPGGLFDVLPREDALGDRFPRGGHWRTCALVGQGASLLRYRFGEMIDGHDAVFRVGVAPTQSYEAHVGRRTTVRVVLDDSFGPEAMSRPSKEAVAVRADTLETLLTYIKSKEERGREAFNIHLLSPEFAIFIARYMQRDPPAMFYSLAIALQKCRNVTVFGMHVSDRSASNMVHIGVTLSPEDVEQTGGWQVATGGNDGGASDLSVLDHFQQRAREYTMSAASMHVGDKLYWSDQRMAVDSFKHAYGSHRDSDGVSNLLVTEAAHHLRGTVKIAQPCYGLDTSLYGVGACANCSAAAPLSVGGVCIDSLEVPVARPGFCEETSGVYGRRAPANCFRPCPMIENGKLVIAPVDDGDAEEEGVAPRAVLGGDDDWLPEAQRLKIAAYPRDLQRCHGGPTQQPCHMLYRKGELDAVPAVGTCFGVGTKVGDAQGDGSLDAQGQTHYGSGMVRDADGRMHLNDDLLAQFRPRTVRGGSKT